MAMKYSHTNVNSPNWEKLADFYQKVFDCKSVPPLRDLHGDWFERASGMIGAHVLGCHLAFPGYENGDGPVLEIFTHYIVGGGPTKFNETGFGHLGIFVDSVEETYQKLLENGGSSDGEIVSHYYENKSQTLTLIYAKDPDGNLVEIMKWTDGNVE